MLHSYTGKSVHHRLHACVFDTARPPSGSVNAELLVTGGGTDERVAGLSARRGCCSRRRRNRTDGRPRPRLPLLESHAGRQRKQRNVRKQTDDRETTQHDTQRAKGAAACGNDAL